MTDRDMICWDVLDDIIIDISINFFIKQKITKSCKWVEVWFCIFYLIKKLKKKKLIVVSIVVFEWQNIIYLCGNCKSNVSCTQSALVFIFFLKKNKKIK
jgi:hypothetical protein